MTPTGRPFFSLYLLIWLAAAIGGTHAYAVHRRPFFARTTGSNLHLAASAGSDASAAAVSPRSAWEERIATDEHVLTIREELVLKYLDQGWPRDRAEAEVDVFLPTRKGRAFVEMRIYSDSQEEMGFETAITYATAFVIGAAFQIVANYYHS